MQILRVTLLLVVVWAAILSIAVDAQRQQQKQQQQQELERTDRSISNELKRPKRGLLLAKAALLGGGAILAKKALIGKGLVLGAALYHK